jgi:hypothetical protein
MLNQETLHKTFDYRDGNLYLKIPRPGSKVGELCGYTHQYRSGRKIKKISYNRKHYNLSNIIFFMFHGYLPGKISFIDKNPLNTKIENLRVGTASDIACYQKKGIRNTSGFKGVSYDKKGKKWKVFIMKFRKSRYLGRFDNPKEAHEAYCKAARELHGEFANFG